MLLVQVLQQQHHTTAAINPLGSSSQSCSVSSSVLVVGGWEIQSCHSLSPKWPEWQTSHPPSNSLQSVLHENSACYFFISRQFHIVIFHHPPTALPFCSGWCVQSKPCCWYRFSNSNITPQLLSIPLDHQVKAAVSHPPCFAQLCTSGM